MIDAERMLGSLVRNAMSGGRRSRSRGRRGPGNRRNRGSLLGGAGKGALALGALGVAMAAFEHFSNKKSAASPAAAAGSTPPPLPPLPPSARAAAPPLPPLPPLPAAADPAAAPTAPRPAQDDALLLVRAMIAAASADHEVDDEERRRILDALEEAEGGADDRAFLRRELDNPVDLDTLAAGAKTPDLARQIYLASCLAIEIDTRAERDYLDRLARRLGLEPERARELEEMVTSGESA